MVLFLNRVLMCKHKFTFIKSIFCQEKAICNTVWIGYKTCWVDMASCGIIQVDGKNPEYTSDISTSY